MTYLEELSVDRIIYQILFYLLIVCWTGMLFVDR